jgi:hypothetical protein
MDVQNRFIDIGAVGLALDQVPENTAWQPQGEPVAVKNPRADLAYLRALFPFVPIWPLPDYTISVVCTVAGQSYDINIGAETIVCAFRADSVGITTVADWWINPKGNAAVPTLANNDPNSDGRNQAIQSPTGQLWYVGQLHTVSVCSTTAGRIVQALCWLAPRRPA